MKEASLCGQAPPISDSPVFTAGRTNRIPPPTPNYTQIFSAATDGEAGALGEDIVGLVLHQHLHAPHVSAPELQAVLHPLDLRQTRTTRVSGHLGIPGAPHQLIL